MGWVVLALAGAPAVDITPPVVAILTPTSGAIMRAPIAVTISASDAASRIDRVEVSVDGGAWATSTLQGNSTYLLSLAGLGDGTHSLLARATDAWANRATTASQSFVVDNTAPLITISGVNNGELSNQLLTPVVSITDAKHATTSLRVNGASFF